MQQVCFINDKIESNSTGESVLFAHGIEARYEDVRALTSNPRIRQQHSYYLTDKDNKPAATIVRSRYR